MISEKDNRPVILNAKIAIIHVVLIFWYVVIKNNNNNTYVISDVETKKIKRTDNQVSLKMYYEPNKQSWMKPQNSKEIVRTTYN